MTQADWWSPFIWFPMFPILFMVLAFVLCFFMMRTMMSRHRSSWHWRRWREDASFPHHQRAIDILNERFARGEIDKSEYDERRRTISQS